MLDTRDLRFVVSKESQPIRPVKILTERGHSREHPRVHFNVDPPSKPPISSLRYTSHMPAAVTLAPSSAHPPAQQGGFRRLWRALKQLFHEMTGAIFAVLTIAWLNAAFRAWTRDAAHWLISLPILVAIIFAFFAVSSFRRARKI
jgi:hypothetical protein